MEISENTIKLLSYFYSINEGIKIDPGNKLYTKNPAGSMCAYAEVPEVFDNPIILSNLAKFLSVISLHENPELDIKEDRIVIKSKDTKTVSTVFQSNAALVQQSNRIPAPQKDIVINFNLTSELLKKIKKTFGVLKVNDLCITAKDGVIRAIVQNTNAKTTDRTELIVGDCESELECTFYYKNNYLNLIESYDYNVEVSAKGLSTFTAINPPEGNKFVAYVVTTFPTNDD